MTPIRQTDEFSNQAHGVRYTDFCRYCREMEPLWDSVRTNKEWASFVKASL